MESKRKALDLAKKFEIVQLCERETASKSEIGRRYGLSSSTLFTILKNKEKIKSAFKMQNSPGGCKKLRPADNTELESILFEWFTQQRSLGIPISGTIIKAKAEEFARRMKLDNFRSTDGWLNRFKGRRGISLHIISGESSHVNEQVVHDWLPFLNSILERYDEKDIYNADETALFYNLLPEKTLAVKGDHCKGGKRSKERVTVLLCTNMTGSDKMKPLIIGKSVRPRAFSGQRNIPCTYESNTKAWMTGQLFTQWLKAFDDNIRGKNRKIVLFVDRCPAHPVIKLTNIELVFFPPNCTSVLQPLDQGIIRAVKHHFRSQLVNSLMRKLMAKETRLKWNVLEAIRGLALAWKEITSETIHKCFRHAGFKRNAEDNLVRESENAEIVPESWKSVSNILDINCSFDDFVGVDAETAVCGLLTDNELIEQQRNCGSESSGNECMEEDSFKIPSRESLLQALEVINSLYLAKSASVEDLTAFKRVEDFVTKHCAKNFKQTTINSFFK